MIDIFMHFKFIATLWRSQHYAAVRHAEEIFCAELFVVTIQLGKASPSVVYCSRYSGSCRRQQVDALCHWPALLFGCIRLNAATMPCT